MIQQERELSHSGNACPLLPEVGCVKRKARQSKYRSPEPVSLDVEVLQIFLRKLSG